MKRVGLFFAMLMFLQLFVPISFTNRNFSMLKVAEGASQATLKVGKATDELLNRYAYYDEFETEQPKSCGIRIILTTERKLRNIKMYGVTWDEGDEGKLVLNKSRLLYQQRELTPERPLVGWLCFFSDTTPPAGIEFIDEDGITRGYMIGQSGEDGSIHLGQSY